MNKMVNALHWNAHGLNEVTGSSPVSCDNLWCNNPASRIIDAFWIDLNGK
jgi:hypothetical protein